MPSVLQREPIDGKNLNNSRSVDNEVGSTSVSASDDNCSRSAVTKNGTVRLTTRFTVVPVYKQPIKSDVPCEVQQIRTKHVSSPNNDDCKSEPTDKLLSESNIEPNSLQDQDCKYCTEKTSLRHVNECKELVPYANRSIIPTETYQCKSLSGCTDNAVPSSLMPIVHPRIRHNNPAPGSSGRNNKEIRKSILKTLHHLPHGATCPPLHEMQGNQRVMTEILKESQKNIEFGTTDGRHIKVVSSLTSSQFLESGSFCGSVNQTNNNENKDETSPVDTRQLWTKKIHFVISCIGASVGLCSFWRLPYLCLTGGRVAFFVPYTIIFCIAGIPLIMAEFVIGQFTKQGPIEAFRKICPVMQGIGVSSLIMSFYASVFYSQVFSESILSLGVALGNLPTFCNSSNSVDCKENSISTESINTNPSFNNQEIVSVPDDLNKETVIVMLFTIIGLWMVVYLALWKSMRSIGKVASVSATVPFAILAIFIGKAVTLPGAAVGLQYFFTPDWSKLLEPEVWVNAAVQVFLSLNIVFGSSLTFASYNKFLNNLKSDVFHISWISFLATISVVLIVFCGLGNIATETGFDISNINYQGADWTFVIYPRILTKMPKMYIWIALFYLLLFLLGLDSQFSSVEVLVTSFKDNNYKFLQKIKLPHEITVLIICLTCLAVSLIFVFRAKAGTLYLREMNMISIGILFIGFVESATIFWLYGSVKLSKNLHQMTGRNTSSFVTQCWRFVTPVSLLILWILSILSYNLEEHPLLTTTGWIIISIGILPIPICGIICIVVSEGDSVKEKIINSLKPRLKINNITRCKYHFRRRQTLFQSLPMKKILRLSSRNDEIATI